MQSNGIHFDETLCIMIFLCIDSDNNICGSLMPVVAALNHLLVFILKSSSIKLIISVSMM